MADRHETVFLRLAAIAQRVDAMAVKHPAGAVPEVVRVLAETALFESHGFVQHRRKGGLVGAAPHLGALSVQLGAALAIMVGFEGRHTSWDPAQQRLFWLVEGATLPVRRLLPGPSGGAKAGNAKPGATLSRPDMADLRHKLAQRLDQLKRR